MAQKFFPATGIHGCELSSLVKMLAEGRKLFWDSLENCLILLKIWTFFFFIDFKWWWWWWWLVERGVNWRLIGGFDHILTDLGESIYNVYMQNWWEVLKFVMCLPILLLLNNRSLFQFCRWNGGLRDHNYGYFFAEVINVWSLMKYFILFGVEFLSDNFWLRSLV